MTQEMFPVDDVDTMADVVLHWYNNLADRIEHFIHVPTGMTLEIGDKKHQLEGEFLDGFLAGIQVALIMVKEQPPIIVTSDNAH